MKVHTGGLFGRQFWVPRLRIITRRRAVVVDLPVPYRGLKVDLVKHIGRRRVVRCHRGWKWHRFGLRTRKLKS
jgi:hypothetical protein